MSKLSKPYNCICLSGGASNGFIQLGALHYAYINNMFEHVTMYIGTSIGSVICLLMSIGYTPMDIYVQTLKLKDCFQFTNFSISMLRKEWGATTIDNFSDNVAILVKKKLDMVPTLKQLYKITGKNFIGVTCQISPTEDMGTKYINYKTDPNMSCIDVIRTSCNLPGICSYLEIDGGLYVDGGLGDHFPIAYAEEYLYNACIFGVCTANFDALFNIDIPFISYLLRLLAFSTIEIQKIRREALTNTHHTILDIKVDKSIISLTIDETDARQKFLKGYTEALNLLENSVNVNPEENTTFKKSDLEGWDIHDIDL